MFFAEKIFLKLRPVWDSSITEKVNLDLEFIIEQLY
jgi:hypothetical protein